MLRMRQAQIEETVGEEQARLRRVEAHLRALEGSTTMDVQDIVIKHTQPLRVAESVAPWGSGGARPFPRTRIKQAFRSRRTGSPRRRRWMFGEA
jgi:hypothetical protein